MTHPQLWGIAAEISPQDFEGYRRGSPPAFGRMLVVIRPWLLACTRRLATRTARQVCLEDPEDLAQETTAALWSWYLRSAARQRPDAIPEFLAYARTTLRREFQRAAQGHEPLRFRQEAAQHLLAGTAGQPSVDIWARVRNALSEWERTPPAALSPRLQRHLQPLITLAMSLDRLPSTDALRHELCLSPATANRLHAELLEALVQTLRGEQS